ncbi:FAD-binding oxidoreductase [Pikeienuella piscinae]|uniref:FAD-binding oxidoreductase n=2 Tax=Pikeienuella piscinae TaxID=2748098 RepID=A0A7M3T791_9RHOB|nr:FAD-dependent oxidoreductase [Pikeienuella piscinae]QIE57872.1 FAD-binding oxidoreductase [Pikeienuella piscinae]
MIGSACAWFLASCAGFDGSVLVVERDPSLETASTTRSGSSIRQQYTTGINIRISQFAAEHIHNFRDQTGGDADAPEIAIRSFGYLFLATEAGAPTLREAAALQRSLGVPTRLLDPAALGAAFPAINTDGVALASHNARDEGYFDGDGMHPWWRKQAKKRGVEFATDEVIAIDRDGDRVVAVRLRSGDRIATGAVVNAAGPRASGVAAMAGLSIPVEPRKRFCWIFDAATPPEGPFPLLIDPSGVYVYPRGGAYHTGCAPEDDRAVAPDDLAMDPEIFMEKVWPTLAARVPAFEALKVRAEWAGHYAYNTLDQNAVIGPHPELRNFLLVNGFSGHGLQQAPAMGRGISELIAYGEYRTLDMSVLGCQRILSGQPFLEKAVI